MQWATFVSDGFRIKVWPEEIGPPLQGLPLPLVAWTGGERPPKRFRAPLFLAMRRALLAEQLETWIRGWGDNPKADTVRTFWRRAKYDAWRSYTERPQQ